MSEHWFVATGEVTEVVEADDARSAVVAAIHKADAERGPGDPLPTLGVICICMRTLDDDVTYSAVPDSLVRT
jgi:hypothetical protein